MSESTVQADRESGAISPASCETDPEMPSLRDHSGNRDFLLNGFPDTNDPSSVTSAKTTDPVLAEK